MLRTSLKYQNIISRAELWRYTITDILAGGIWSDLSSCLYPPVYWRVISDRYQFPSLLGRYTDTSAATGSGSVRWRCLCSRWLHNIRYQSGPGHGLTDQRIFQICQTDCWLLTADWTKRSLSVLLPFKSQHWKYKAKTHFLSRVPPAHWPLPLLYLNSVLLPPTFLVLRLTKTPLASC